jgi:hypothetical protein
MEDIRVIYKGRANMALEAHVCLIHGMELQIDTKK